MKRVLLVNLGTTREPSEEGVRSFLEEFLSDPMVVDYPGWLWRPILNRILRSRPARVAEQYRAIWTDEGSPLEAGTRRLAEALGPGVGYAYRYGAPPLREAIETADASLVVVPLFPQRTSSTTGTIEALVADRTRLFYIAPDDPGYIDALADLWRRTVGDAPPDHLLVSFHGIPVRYDRAEGGMYQKDCRATYRALLKRIGLPEDRASLTFQSRFGPEPWLGPQTAKVLTRLGRSGVKSVAVATPGFLTEGLETLEEIGIRGRHSFIEAGGERFLRVPCVEAHPSFVDSLKRSLEAA